jgi:flagellar FliL protein
MAKDDEVKDGEEVEEPNKSKLKLIVLASIVVILGAGGFFGWKWYSAKTAESATSQKAEDVTVIYPLKSFIVNLIDKKGVGKRYLKVAIELEVAGEEQSLTVEKNIPQLRDTILLLLSNQSLKQINTLEGKLELKQALLSRMNRVLDEGVVRRIYFTEFVVQ